jgi:3-oxoadipate enol-lactonase
VEGPLTGPLAYETSGTGGETVILVHAGVADRRMWGPLLAELPPDRRYLRYDMRGFGESALEPGVVSNARDLIGLLDELGAERAAIVGASFGGRVALEVASNWPDRVRGLALLDPALPGREPSPRFQSYDEAEEEALAEGDIDRAVELNVRMWVDGPRDPSEVDPAVRALVADMQRRAYELQVGVDAELDSLEIDPARITAPTVIAVGELDVEDFHAIARELAATIPNVVGQTVIEGAAHLPALERPAEVARLILPVI